MKLAPIETQTDTLADYVSHEEDRVRVAFEVVPRMGLTDSTLETGKLTIEPEDRGKRYRDCSTNVYVNGKQVAKYGFADLPHVWIPVVRTKIQELEQGRAGAEEVVGAIDTIIAELYEKNRRLNDADLYGDVPYMWTSLPDDEEAV